MNEERTGWTRVREETVDWGGPVEVARWELPNGSVSRIPVTLEHEIRVETVNTWVRRNEEWLEAEARLEAADRLAEAVDGMSVVEGWGYPDVLEALAAYRRLSPIHDPLEGDRE